MKNILGFFIVNVQEERISLITLQAQDLDKDFASSVNTWIMC